MLTQPTSWFLYVQHVEFWWWSDIGSCFTKEAKIVATIYGWGSNRAHRVILVFYYTKILQHDPESRCVPAKRPAKGYFCGHTFGSLKIRNMNWAYVYLESTTPSWWASQIDYIAYANRFSIRLSFFGLAMHAHICEYLTRGAQSLLTKITGRLVFHFHINNIK